MNRTHFEDWLRTIPVGVDIRMNGNKIEAVVEKGDAWFVMPTEAKGAVEACYYHKHQGHTVTQWRNHGQSWERRNVMHEELVVATVFRMPMTVGYRGLVSLNIGAHDGKLVHLTSFDHVGMTEEEAKEWCDNRLLRARFKLIDKTNELDTPKARRTPKRG
jgi:hypothetical protein